MLRPTTCGPYIRSRRGGDERAAKADKHTESLKINQCIQLIKTKSPSKGRSPSHGAPSFPSFLQLSRVGSEGTAPGYKSRYTDEDNRQTATARRLGGRTSSPQTVTGSSTAHEPLPGTPPGTASMSHRSRCLVPPPARTTHETGAGNENAVAAAKAQRESCDIRKSELTCRSPEETSRRKPWPKLK